MSGAVVVTPFTPTLGVGRALRTYAIVRALAHHGPVDVVYARFGAERPDRAYADIERARLHEVVPGRGLGRALAYVRARGSGVPDGFARGVSPELAARAAALAGDDARLIAEGAIAAAALLPVARRRPVIYSAQNLESAFRHTLSTGGLGGLERFERRLLERCAESWMVSPADAEGARRLAPGARVRIVPNCVDVAAIRPVTLRAGAREAMFVADLSWEPNRNALRFLLDDVMPAVWRRAPDVRLTVVGRGSDALPAPDERVTLAGFVDDLRAAYERAGCVAVPLLEGGGSPLKFVEALAYGLPVVATPKAAAGLEIVAGEHYVEGPPEGEGFAAALLTALEDGARVAPAGRGLAERRYSIEALAEAVAP